MNWIILLSCITLVVGSCGAFCYVVTRKISKTQPIENNIEAEKEITKSENVSISIMQDLDSLENHVKSMKIPKLNKEKILKVIDFEKDMIKYSIIADLGKAEYEKLRK